MKKTIKRIGCAVIALIVLFFIGAVALAFLQPEVHKSAAAPSNARNAPSPEGEPEGADAKPKADVEYIDLQTGDKWGFVLGVSNDRSTPIDLAWHLGKGMQGRDMYEMRSLGNSCYSLHENGTDEDSGITVYVYPGRDSIRVTRDGRKAIFKTADSFGHAVSSIDPDYTPARYAINVGDHGGKWDPMESGEVAYVFPSGEYARSQWVKDGDKFYYVDVSGCRMLDNWAHDGFYAGADGAWDKTVKCIDRNVLPHNGKVYTDESQVEWTFQFTRHDDGTIDGTARQVYPKPMDYIVNYRVRSFGSSTYALYNVKDEFESWHLCVLDDGQTIRISGAGVTEVYHLQ